MKDVLIAVLGMGGLGLIWAVILVICNKKLHVDENPLIEKVIDCLPGVNCGACGLAGCGALGEAIVEEGADPTLCPVNEEEDIQEIAKLVGREVDTSGPKMIAKLHCQGTQENCETIADYSGLHSCIAENITNGGTKSCQYGCMGHGDCVWVCPFDALEMAANGLPIVDEEKCTGCGKCIDECPRDLFKLIPKDQKIFVLCSSKDPGAMTKKACKVGCTGCTICAKKVDENVFAIDSFLSTVNYEAQKEMTEEKMAEAVEKCPQNIIIRK